MSDVAVRVLIAHNRYQSSAPSGENRIVDSEIVLLQAAGIEVIPFIEESDELIDASPATLATAAAGPFLSPRGTRRLHSLLSRYRPDVLHIHNVFPLISPWVIRTATSAGVPVVQTVHNYRHTCVMGMHIRDGIVCDDCQRHSVPWPAVVHGCYRGSRPQSALMAIGQVVHRPTWRMVRRFMVASPHMEQRLLSIGVPRERLEWRPTYAEDLGTTPLPEEGGVAFIGRLDQAKGIRLLLKAWTPSVAALWGRLVIAGDGPLAAEVSAQAAADPSIEWRGALDVEGVRDVMRQARLIALPSLWLEGFPRVAAEAMSTGRPLLLWEGAGLSRLAECGAAWAIDSTPETWGGMLLRLDQPALVAASLAARRFYEERCSPKVAVHQLQRVYASVTAGRPAA